MKTLNSEIWLDDRLLDISLNSGSSTPQPAGNTTTIQKSDPWSGQQPFLTGGGATGGNLGAPGAAGQPITQTPGTLPSAASLYQNYTPQYFPGSTVAGFTPAQQQGQQSEINFGANGTPEGNAADANSAATLNGDYLSAGNPYFSQMADRVTASAMPALTSTFNQGNRINSPGAAYAVSSGLGDAIGALGYQNYSDERTNQLRAQGLAPTLQGADLQRSAALSDAGGQQQTQNQANINDQVQRFNFQQQLPYNQLGLYNQMIQGNYGGTSTLTQPYFGPASGSGLAGGLSGALSGAGTGFAVGGPYGAAAGGILGGLFGSGKI